MKNLIIIFLLCGLTFLGQAQASGNINYLAQQYLPEQNINVQFLVDDRPRNSRVEAMSNDLVISVKGLSNVRADSYVAVFTITQVGKTAEEANKLLDQRVESVRANISTSANVTVFVDMVSFVPMYEFEKERKIFSKRTYNEIPKGFELKKSIHVKYKQHDVLNDIITACAGAEVYDLVRVDYFSDDMASIKKELMARSKTLLKEKITTYGGILGDNLSVAEKQMADGFIIKYPIEAYKSYQAYASTSLDLRKPASVNQASKSKSMYYQPIMDKEFDFVINPTIVEPVIQVMYEIKVRFERDKLKDSIEKINTEYMLVTPNGDVRSLDIR